MYLRFLFSIFLILSFPFHCLGESLSPIESFYKNQPELKQYYKELNPTSIYGLKLKENEKFDFQMDILQLIREKSKDCSDVANYLNKCENIVQHRYKLSIKHINKLKQLMSDNDALYYFIYNDKNVEETGLLLLSGSGDIKWREVRIRAYLKSNSVENPGRL